jgi:hypothetical protein
MGDAARIDPRASTDTPHADVAAANDEGKKDCRVSSLVLSSFSGRALHTRVTL